VTAKRSAARGKSTAKKSNRANGAHRVVKLSRQHGSIPTTEIRRAVRSVALKHST
jgi:hypothetical protein